MIAAPAIAYLRLCDLVDVMGCPPDAAYNDPLRAPPQSPALATPSERSERSADRDPGDIVALVRLAVDENVLVHITELAGKMFADGRRERDEVAHSVESRLGLETRRIEIEKRFAGEGDSGTAVWVERQSVTDEGAHPPAGPVRIASPPLFEADACAQLAAEKGREI